MINGPAEFLNVPYLLEASQPKPRPNWFWYAAGVFGLVVLASTWAGSQSPGAKQVVDLLGMIAMFGVVVGMGILTSRTVKRQRAEQARVEAIEELVQLRRWDQSAAMLEAMLSQPTLTPGARIQALIYLAGVLARYHRFTDAITVQDYLIENVPFDPGTAHGIKLMRAMSMLHEDHLFDADRAINDLKRDAPESAGVALIQIYRDVKTGHPAEAIEQFQAKLPELRTQLGHRVADAYALVARAHDLLGQESEAAAAWQKATLLTWPDELARRYSEVVAVKEKYPAAGRPGGDAEAKANIEHSTLNIEHRSEQDPHPSPLPSTGEGGNGGVA